MKMNRFGPSVLAFAVAFGLSCTSTYLYDERRENVVPSDRTVAVEGSFCTPATNEVIRPIKIVIAMDASQSMRVTDPNGSRAQAVVDLLNALPQEPEIYISVMLFAGSTPVYLTTDSQFDQVIAMTPTDRLNLKQKIEVFVAPGGQADRDSTDFVKTLAEIYSLIHHDIATTRQNGGQTVARYSVIFLSDGEPTKNQDDELLCGDAVRRIRQLKDLADDCRFNAVHVFLPNQPIASSACDFDGGIVVPPSGRSCIIPTLPPGACPMLIVNQNAERLQRMAELGGGDFRDFRNNEPINFLAFKFGNVRRNYVFDKLVVSNFSAPLGGLADGGDADSDGIKDVEEATHHTVPWLADTDGDGFSDGVEVFYAARGANFTPDQLMLPDGGGVDPGCPVELRGVDSDCDGITDCDEEIIGSNALRIDSDDDGVPDAIEWHGRTQPSSPDLDQDPDNDRVLNADEVAMHMDPLNADSASLSTQGYRYQLHKSGGINDAGQQCYSFRVDNVLLADTAADTRDAGNPDGGAPFFRRGEGFNDVMVSISMRPGDDPGAHTIMKLFRTDTPRYPVGGIRSPVDGIIHVEPTDFKAGCSTLGQ